jgi:hypothetical protein
VAKRNQDSKKGAAMTETTPSSLGNVITIDDEGAWNALLDAEADQRRSSLVGIAARAGEVRLCLAVHAAVRLVARINCFTISWS